MDERYELLRQIYATINSGDLDLSVAHPELCILQAEEILGTAGEFHGHDGARRSWEELREAFNDLRFDPEEYDELDDGRMLVRCRWTGTGVASGVAVNAAVWHLWSFRDGLISRLEVYPSKRRALAAGVQSTPSGRSTPS